MGHSEGSDVAPWVAVENEHVTHVVALAPGGMSLMFDFVALVRRQIASGEISQQEGDEEIREIKEGFRKVFEDPTSTTKKWAGETHLRWSTFFRPALDAWRHVDKPVYIGICRDDRNTAVESGEAIELEFIRLRKKNLTSKLWPCDHYFMATNNNETTSGQEMRLEVLNDIFEWVKK